MTMWHLVHQDDNLPISVGRADGVSETPPPGLIKYIELARGAWTLEPATKPLGTEGVEWPVPCVWRSVTRCPGSMSYVEHVKKPVFVNGKAMRPDGWQCEMCGAEEVGGFSSMSIDL